MNKAQGETGNPSGKLEPLVDEAPAQLSSDPSVSRRDAAPSSPVAAPGNSPSFWAPLQRPWRRLTAIVRSVRGPDEQPPFSDD